MKVETSIPEVVEIFKGIAMTSGSAAVSANLEEALGQPGLLAPRLGQSSIAAG